jgi:hypothetical protein
MRRLVVRIGPPLVTLAVAVAIWALAVRWSGIEA